MKGEHKEGYRRPRRGEKREVRQPLKIDNLSPEVGAAIQKLRAQGKTWREISELSTSFAGEQLTDSALIRWYDIRVEQVRLEVLARADRAKEIASAFAGKGFDKLPEAVQSALSSAVFSLAESQGEKERTKFMVALNQLAWLIARNRQLDQEEKRLALESKKLETVTEKVRGLKDQVAKKKLTSAELAKKLDEIYDIAQ